MVLSYIKYLKENSSDFLVGDKVLYIYNDDKIVTDRGLRKDLYGKVGTIIGFDEDGEDYAVEFEEEFRDGHNCDDQGEDGHCYYIMSDALQLVPKETIKEEDIEWF
jgi:hypothetical protein